MDLRDTKRGINLIKIVCCIYAILVLAFKLLRLGGDSNAIPPELGSSYKWSPFVPVSTLLFHWKYYLGNAVLLMPAGFLGRKYGDTRTFWLVGVIISFALEVLQPVLDTGVSDALSIMLLLLGYAVGGLVFAVYSRTARKQL